MFCSPSEVLEEPQCYKMQRYKGNDIGAFYHSRTLSAGRTNQPCQPRCCIAIKAAKPKQSKFYEDVLKDNFAYLQNPFSNHLMDSQAQYLSLPLSL